MVDPKIVRKRGRRVSWVVRGLWIVAGAAWFVWLGYEDVGLEVVLALSAWISLAYVATLWRRWSESSQLTHRQYIVRASIAGLVGGATAPLLADILMLVKVSLHGHAVPDFTARDLGAVLGRTPIWALAGLAAGLALGLVHLARGPARRL
jgi:hypothetical protein